MRKCPGNARRNLSFYDRLVDALLGSGLAGSAVRGKRRRRRVSLFGSDFFRDIPIYITENGRAAADMVSGVLQALRRYPGELPHPEENRSRTSDVTTRMSFGQIVFEAGNGLVKFLGQ